MKTFTKALLGTGAAAAVMVSGVQPAMARDNGISAGEIIAGAVVIGGIAAIASSIGKNSDDDRYGYNNRYDRAGYGRDGGSSRDAVQACVRTAENRASRSSYGRADVTDVRDVKRTNRGYTIKGKIAVNDQGRGWNKNSRARDTGNFTCKVQNGRVVDLDFKGIRGL